MNDYYPKDLRYLNEAQRMKIRREQEGLQEVLALLEQEEKARIEQAQWQIENEEVLQKTLLAIRKLYYEKRLEAINEHADQELEAVKRLASEQAKALEAYFLFSDRAKEFDQAIKKAFAFNTLSAELKEQISQAELKVDLSQVRKVKVENMDSVMGKIHQQIGKELLAYRGVLEEFAEFGEAIGESFAKGASKGGNAFHNALKEILADTLRFLERFIIAAEVKSATENFFILGPLGLLKAAAESAGIAAMFETVRQEILSFGSGGIIDEPVVGVGTKSKRQYVLGEQGDEMVIPISEMQVPSKSETRSSVSLLTVVEELKGLRRDVGSLRLRVSGMDLALAVEKGRRRLEDCRL